MFVKYAVLSLAGKATCHDTSIYMIQVRMPSMRFVWVAFILCLTCFFARKYPCPWEGCLFRARQKSNLATHIRGVQYVFFLFHYKFIKLPV